jgi:hypothetical protein
VNAAFKRICSLTLFVFFSLLSLFVINHFEVSTRSPLHPSVRHTPHALPVDTALVDIATLRLACRPLLIAQLALDAKGLLAGGTHGVVTGVGERGIECRGSRRWRCRRCAGCRGSDGDRWAVLRRRCISAGTQAGQQ